MRRVVGWPSYVGQDSTVKLWNSEFWGEKIEGYVGVSASVKPRIEGRQELVDVDGSTEAAGIEITGGRISSF